VIFYCFCFSRVVQKQMLGEVNKLNNHLMASCVKNIRTKNYQNLIIGFQVTVKMSGMFFETLSIKFTGCLIKHAPCKFVSSTVIAVKINLRDKKYEELQKEF